MIKPDSTMRKAVITRDESHNYYVDGKGPLPSVTTILDATLPKPALVPWAVNATCDYFVSAAMRARLGCGAEDDKAFLSMNDVFDISMSARKESTRIKEEAADTGTEVHALVEKWATGVGPVHDRSTPAGFAFAAFLSWADQWKVTPHHSELMVHHPKQNYAGTVDIIASVKMPEWKKHRLYLIDVKSSKGHYPEHAYQLAAYAEAFGKVDGIGVIRCDKTTGMPYWKDYTDRRRDSWNVFKRCRALYKALKGR